MGIAWTDTVKEIAGCKLHVSRGGSGRAVLVLHHDIGTPDRLPFYDALAAANDVIIPRHPGFGKQERPEWLRQAQPSWWAAWQRPARPVPVLAQVSRPVRAMRMPTSLSHFVPSTTSRREPTCQVIWLIVTFSLACGIIMRRVGRGKSTNE